MCQVTSRIAHPLALLEAEPRQRFVDPYSFNPDISMRKDFKMDNQIDDTRARYPVSLFINPPAVLMEL
jgi:hypothetical protein